MQTIRARVAFHSRQHGFDKCMQQILDPVQPITGTQVAELHAYWGDPLSAADEQFLRSCLAEAGAAGGPILLSGANLLTLILGALCAKEHTTASQVWCLESDRHWANVIRSWLTEYRIGTAHVIQSQARLYGDYVWYAVDTGRLAPAYQLVICDGARATAKGVIGAISRVTSRLDERFTILARNVRETSVLRELSDWARTREAKFALIDKQEGFIKISRQPAVVEEPGAAPKAATVNGNGARTPGGRPRPKPKGKRSLNA
ncbi:MAG: hypothetical protein PVH91_03995 [Pseudomonadales bacterium]|jgi:hypothetical protein